MPPRRPCPCRRYPCRRRPCPFRRSPFHRNPFRRSPFRPFHRPCRPFRRPCHPCRAMPPMPPPMPRAAASTIESRSAGAQVGHLRPSQTRRHGMQRCDGCQKRHRQNSTIFHLPLPQLLMRPNHFRSRHKATSRASCSNSSWFFVFADDFSAAFGRAASKAYRRCGLADSALPFAVCAYLRLSCGAPENSFTGAEACPPRARRSRLRRRVLHDGEDRSGKIVGHLSAP